MRSPLTPNIAGAFNSTRRSEAVRICCSGEKHRARIYFTICSENIEERTLKLIKIRRIKLVIDAASFHAPARSSRASKPVNVGRKADDSAPPATRLKIKSGSVEAA